MQNTSNGQPSPSTSDDESCCLDTGPQPSSSTSFCSSHSQYTSTPNHKVPINIFFDNGNIITGVYETNKEQEDTNEEDDSFSIHIHNMEEVLYSSQGAYCDEEDDVTVHSTESYSEDNLVHDSSNLHGYGNNGFHQMTSEETASYKILSLLDSAGAPRVCYDRLVALLKKLSKSGFDVQKAIKRDTLMQRLAKYKARPRIQICSIKERDVFRFNFQDMLQDLLYSCSKHLHNILPPTVHNSVPTGTENELWNTEWMRDTFAMDQYKDFDSSKDIMLPIILYMDKTGTDVNQRYSLEPVLFSLTALPREQRESRHAWRHIGFVPPIANEGKEESSTSLQFYHDCLSYLLDGLREAQKNPPTVGIRSPEGNIVQRRAFLPLMVVMGDQLSQDTLCGRLKANSGGAGRVHRSCMCSYLNIDDPYHECRNVNSSTLNQFTYLATISEEDMDARISSDQFALSTTKDRRITKSFLLKQRTMFRGILRHPYTTHPIKNGFTEIDFGSWPSGIHNATLDDFMHSVEAGMLAYITETVYDGLTKKEKESVEQSTRSILTGQRCSVLSTFPRWRLQPGFTRQTLMTSGERVGSVLALSLSLNDPLVRETIQQGHQRQVQKYLDLSMEPSSQMDDKSVSIPEFYLEQHMHQLDDQSILHTLEHMIRHGFSLDLLDDLDPFQINQMVWHCSDLFKTTGYPENYPKEDIESLYTDLGKVKSIVPKEKFRVVKYALQTQPTKLLSNYYFRKIEGVTGKHFKKKANKKGEGSSAAVLSSKMETLNIFLEYVLCFHAFRKYSSTLPLFLQCHYANIKAGNRFVIEYFQKLIYRGNASVDSRFPKIHAQCRISMNTELLNTVMNFSCETGERLLKTEAKGISRTAQQRGNTTFLTQTMSRLQDRSVLDSFAMYLEEKDDNKGKPLETLPQDRFARICPHFIYDVQSSQIVSVDRKNEWAQPNKKSGFVEREVLDALKKHEGETNRFEIYNEVVLRDQSRIRASPNYANSGPWYDYANVSWERTNDTIVETYLLPARCLCFFSKVDLGTGHREIMALVHSVDQFSTGRITGRTDTLITRHYLLEYDSKGVPVTHVVPVASIDSAIRCFPHTPSNKLFDCNSPGIMYLLPRNQWTYMWMAVNHSLMESNSKDKVKHRKGKLIPLYNTHWLQSVRKRHNKYMEAKCIKDLQ
jgi:hypothetical protein